MQINQQDFISKEELAVSLQNFMCEALAKLELRVD